jgi:hypothetical protein
LAWAATGTVSRPASTIAGLTTNAGHEYAEQQTDNFINSQLSMSSPPCKVGSGWGILNGPEGSVGDADICAPARRT